jgi:ATP-binding cassette, subfamily C, bacteriocin exporter
MKKLRQARRCFVRQLSDTDCGCACLAMIFNYAGMPHNISSFREKSITGEYGSSMLDLKKLSLEMNVAARCVEMEVDFLREISFPCILHTTNENGQDHFVVCYGTVRKGSGHRFLIADPARQVHFLSEDQLRKMWTSRAAIYFDNLTARPFSGTKNPWRVILSPAYFPKGLLICIPFLNLCSVALGVAVSWVLQKGLSDPLTEKKNSIIIGVILLLLIITVAKSLFSYVRQRVLIVINNSVNEQLVSGLINKIVCKSPQFPLVKSVRKSMSEVQRIQNALSAFVATLLSDGSLILLMLSASFYLLPVAGVINILYLIAISVLTIRSLPGLSFDYSNLNELAGATENFMLKEVETISEPVQQGIRANFHKDNHRRYLSFANRVAIHLSKLNLMYECLGAVNIIITLSFSLLRLHLQKIEYSEFMVIVILSYLISTLMPKISNAIFVIADGTEAAAIFNKRTREN